MRRFAAGLVLIVVMSLAVPAAAQVVEPDDPPEETGLPGAEENGGGGSEEQGKDTGSGEESTDGGEGEEGVGEEGVEAQAVETLKPLGRDCTETDDNVLFCEGNLANRVPSFDDVPLDVDVTLPGDAEVGDDLPTIVIMHGFGGSKEDFESSNGPEGDDSREFHYNNVFYAQRGYAVVNYSARGFGDSCGSEGSRDDPNCDDGYVHLADTRFEARDTQHLLGLMVDDDESTTDAREDVADPDKLAVTGLSYGGGQSIELAVLRDRIRTCEPISGTRSVCEQDSDEFEPWESPGPDRDPETGGDNTPLQIAAAFPRWPWSDLVYSLVPNGRFLDTDAPSPDDEQSLQPIGIPIASYITLLYGLGNSAGFFCGEAPNTGCQDQDSDITAWYTRILQGEDYDDQRPVPPGSAKPTYSGREIAEEIYDHHQGLGGLDVGGQDAAPLLIQNGWTDDLFPAHEALRAYNYLRGDSKGEVSLQFGDLGHPRGSNKEEVDEAFNDQGAAFLDEQLDVDPEGPDIDAEAPEDGEVTAYTQTCPPDAPAGGPFTEDEWEDVAADEDAVTFGDDPDAVPPPPSQTITSPGNDDPYGGFADPVRSLQDPCGQVADQTGPRAGVATYRGEVSDGFTMVGRPTVTATVAQTPALDDIAQLDSRLWDVGPDGSQTLISRGGYRLEQTQAGEVEFQLNGNGWCFEDGHTPKLELLGKDEPYLRPSSLQPFAVTVSEVEATLPVADTGDCENDGGSGGGGGGGDGDGGGNGGGGDGGGNGGGGNGSNGGDGSGGEDPLAATLARGVLLRAMATSECDFYKQNFGGPRKAAALEKCVTAALATVIDGVAPATSCGSRELSARRRRGERRSDLRACVLAATSASDRVRRFGL